VYKGIDYFTATKEVTGKTSIAVLNFDNVRKFQDYEWLGDDIAGSLSYKLGGIPEVRVIDRFQILNKLGEVDPEKASILEYKINQIANNIDVDLILHGQFTILDSIVKVIAFYADTKTFSQTRLMNEKYSLDELSDIPTYINDKISDFIKNDPRFKENSK
jgi:TolB-like protein